MGGGVVGTDPHDPRNLSASCLPEWRQKMGEGGRKLLAVTACRLSSPCQPIASCHPVCLAVLLSEINNGEGRGAPVEMCGINLPAPKNRIFSENGGGGGIPTSSPLLQCCGDCLSPVWSLSAIASCRPVCLAVLLSETNNGEGRGAQ